MSADGRCGALMCLLGLGFAGNPAVAGESPDESLPDEAFLEYLGLWDASDEDWQLLYDIVAGGEQERSDPEPEGEESTEAEDEG